MNKIRVDNFKSLVDCDIRIGKLTVLSGLNGSGKSSILQIFSMLNQRKIDSDNMTAKYNLRGRLVNLGKVSDIYSDEANSDLIDIYISIEGLDLSVKSEARSNSQNYIVSAIDVAGIELLKKISDGFQLIQADRIVPHTQYDSASSDDLDACNLGSRGEYCVDYLSKNARLKISNRRTFPMDAIGVSKRFMEQISPTDSLLDQVCGWMQHISPGVKLSSEDIIGTDFVKLKYNYTGDSIASEGNDRRPTHVGFGITYCLPIIVASLIAKQNSFLLIENPEAHLHPQGQFAMGILLSKCAEDGVNIIVETHSDHVLNGIRVATKQQQIKHEDIAIHFFSRDINTGVTFIQSPNVLANGQITNWPTGFFDQWSNSLDILLA